MSYFFTKQWLFSEVKGVVLHHDKPVAGAEVERIHDMKKPISEIVRSDAEGRFSFPAIEIYSFMRLVIPHEPYISQTILIRFKGIEYKAWRHGKHNYDVNGELGGRPINLVCELETKPDHREELFYGISVLGE